MPAAYQGTLFRSTGAPLLDLATPAGRHDRTQRRLARSAQGAERASIWRSRPDEIELAARIQSYELAYRMQTDRRRGGGPRPRERADARACTGLNDKRTADFGRKCLITRRLLEKGVRFIQLYSGGGHIEDTWDGHNDCITNHKLHAGETDQPIAALMADLKRTGLVGRDAADLGRRVRPHADQRGGGQARAATTTGTASPCGWPARA